MLSNATYVGRKRYAGQNEELASLPVRTQTIDPLKSVKHQQLYQVEKVTFK